MTVIDASVLIAHLDADDAHHAQAEVLLEAAGATPLVASRLTLAQVLVGPARAGKLELAIAALAQFGIDGVGLHADASVRLAGALVVTFDPYRAPAAGGRMKAAGSPRERE